MQYNKITANGLHEILNAIRIQKGFTKEELLDFVQYKSPMHDAYLLKNMNKAVERLMQAVFDQEPICIIGDYDVDGLTATTIMYRTFVNFMPTYYIIPNRLNDGYGISVKLIDKAKEKGVKLIITVDNGINGQQAIEYANSLGMEVIVTDHHPSNSDYYPALITIDPQIDDYPFKGICGCMVAYKLCTVLLKELNLNYDNREYIELTTLATIADIMPLIDENRTLIYKGLKYLENSCNIGLKTLIEKLKIKEINAHTISFVICPCLNAAGRMESPDYVMDLFLADDEVMANKYADKLIDLNNQRKKFQDEVMKFITIDNSHPVIIAHIPSKISGIAGIIASRIQDIYGKPAFAVGGVEELSGSGRSNNFPINEIVKNCDCATGGGHAEACGIKFKKIDFDKVQAVADELYNNYQQTEPLVDVIEINIKDIGEELVKAIETLRPFGKGNESPLFISTTFLANMRVVGKNINCTQFTFEEDWSSVKGILFDVTDVHEGMVEVIYTLEFNEFPSGVFTPQMQIKSVKNKAVSK